jgi:predicted DCC family thiol-disulfide oxidoreductase YuxK
MKANISNRVAVFFDGGCPLCSREIEHYRKKPRSSQIDWIDIDKPGFDAKLHGLDPEKIHARFHAKNQDGIILEGVDAFNAIWHELGILKPLSWAAESRLTRPVLDLGYSVFAWARPYLPRRKGDDCDTDRCDTK